MNAKTSESNSEIRVGKASKRAVIVAALSVLALLLIVYLAMAYNVSQHQIWSPNDNKWTGGATSGYTEGQAAVFAFNVSSLVANQTETVGICLDLTASAAGGGTAYAFTELVSPGSSLVSQEPNCGPFGNCTGSSPPWPPLNLDFDQLVWGSNVDVTSVSFAGVGSGGNDCTSNQLKYVAEFKPASGSTTGVLYYAGVFAQPGAPIASGGTVPPGQGASSIGPTTNFVTQLVTGTGGGSKTINLKGADIAAAVYDLGVVKECPADLTPSQTPPPPPFVFTVDITNNGPSPALVANTAFTDTYDPTELSWTGVSRFYYDTPDDQQNFSNSGSGSCALVTAGVQGAFTCTPTSPDPLAAGQTIRVELDFNVVAGFNVDVSNDATLVNDDGTPANNGDTCSQTTPVTVSAFLAQRQGKDVRFEWQTVAEVGNVGFNIYADTADGLQKINEEIIRSHKTDSRNPQDYVYEASGVEGDTFFIEDVSIELQTRMHGPFVEGEAAGARVEMEPVDWAAIHAEHEAKEAQREEQARERAAALSGNKVRAASSTGLSHVTLPIMIGGKGGTPPPPSDDRINFDVSELGLYHVTYEDLKNAGFDLLLKNPDHLALLNQGQPVPIRVESQWAFGPGDFIEFYGEGLDTIYTDTNVYTLVFDPTKALRMGEDDTAAGTAAPEVFYMETLLLGDENAYSAQIPTGGDPWYDTELFVRTNTQTWNYDLLVDNYVPGTAPTLLSVGVWGRGGWTGVADNHHMQFAFNGQPIKEIWFGGTTDASFDHQLANGLLQEGSNTLGITLIGDTGALWDFTYLDSYGLIYPRAFVARGGALTFEEAGEVFQVSGLPIGDVDVYRMANGTVEQLTNVEVAGGNATFAGSTEKAKYVVVSAGAKKTPLIEVGRPYTDITSGSYDYLIISHPDFINELGALVTARTNQGFSVLTVDVDDVYDQFAYGIFDAQAIKDYASYAAQNMGTDYFLLVGGDTYDYRGYLASGGMSFIPSLYEQIGSFDDLAPVDPQYVDLDGDLVQDRAIGRFPVRSSQELAWMIEKTLAYQTNVSAVTGYSGKAVYAADGGFKDMSDHFAGLMGAGWQVERAYLDDMPVADAKAKLIADIENGAALTSYIGHSSTAVWTFDGLFSSADAAALTNSLLPTVVSQWGCSNNYYVDPAYNTMAHQFLIAGDAGAAAVMGVTGFSYLSSQEKLGEYVTPKLVQPGKTVGAALQEAKAEMAAVESPSAHVDVMLGWMLLGDPALVIQPTGSP